MKQAAIQNLSQIKNLLLKLPFDAYSTKCKILSDATIGEHVRHIVEFYTILVSESATGELSYDNRKRDRQIEIDTTYTIAMIDGIINKIDPLDDKKELKIEGSFSSDDKKKIVINSSLGRELAYCIEHSIHHQAIIKAALISLKLQHLTESDFGVAYSTIKYRNNACAQ